MIYVVIEVLYWTQGWETDRPDSSICVQYGPNFILKEDRMAMLNIPIMIFFSKCQFVIPGQ